MVGLGTETEIGKDGISPFPPVDAATQIMDK
jgi:hypothetical protein